jgi:phage shock protein C
MEGARQLVRSRDRWVAGVLGGFAERFGWAPLRVRIAFAILSAASAAFPGILVYLLLWFMLPDGRKLEKRRFRVERP